jgi:hypothetical protein
VVKGGKVVSGSPKHETGEEERLSGPASFWERFTPEVAATKHRMQSGAPGSVYVL